MGIEKTNIQQKKRERIRENERERDKQKKYVTKKCQKVQN